MNCVCFCMKNEIMSNNSMNCFMHNSEREREREREREGKE